MTPRSILTLLICLFSLVLEAQDGLSYGKGKIKHRFSAGPVISFYKNHPQHTANTKSKPGLNVAYKTEILLGKKTNILIGLEYMNQGISFKGYYSAPGFTYLFDRTYNYTHEIRIQEVQLPIGFKLAGNREKDKPFTPYCFGGVGFRYIFKAATYIESDSSQNVVYEGKTDLTFENHVIEKHMNAFFYAGGGVQRNFREKGGAAFFELTFRRGISRFHYTGNKNSNSIDFSNSNLGITIGWRF